MHHLMVLWVTTVIPPSLLQTNCPAKPHSYRQLCSGSGSEISPNNSWGIFLSSIHSSGLGEEPGTINSSWHKLPGEGGMFIHTPTPNLWSFWKHLSGHWHQKRRVHVAQVRPPLVVFLHTTFKSQTGNILPAEGGFYCWEGFVIVVLPRKFWKLGSL